MKAIDFLHATYEPDKEFLVRRRAVCNDGYSISIQGGTYGHYCTPRVNCDVYERLELGFPSAVDSIISEYAESIGNDTETVFGYVPIDVVERLVENHGGIKE